MHAAHTAASAGAGPASTSGGSSSSSSSASAAGASSSRAADDVTRELISSVQTLSPLELSRLKWTPTLPSLLQGDVRIERGPATSAYADQAAIQTLFPHTYGQASVHFRAATQGSGAAAPAASSETLPKRPFRVGVVLSGGPASGGHNVITGLYDMLKTRVHAGSQLYGFLDGPGGLIDAKYIELDAKTIDRFRNQGGFHMVGSGRTKIETKQQFAATAAVCEQLQLDGLVIAGGDDSNTNAALLAEYFLELKHRTRVIGTPKTIDGDLKNEFIEVSFGFDTAVKVYSEEVAALCADAISARKTYHFIRLMGRTASHITLEVALQTHPNVALIGEEVLAKKYSLRSITKLIADTICTRALAGKHYGVVILPEGLVDFLPDVGQLISELNELMAGGKGLPSNLVVHLSPGGAATWQALPPAISQQLLLDRDPHGNVQVSKIESERLVASLVEGELARRKKLGTYKGSPSFVCHFLGYQGRCGLPSNFDANYCYALGVTAGLLLAHGHTGMLACVQRLAGPPADWQCGGLPLTHLMNLERRHGHDKPVIRKALVRLEDAPFQVFEGLREGWKYADQYRNPGPLQFHGPFADHVNLTLAMEHGARLAGSEGGGSVNEQRKDESGKQDAAKAARKAKL